jgi:Arc/MetJ-type ribon-helix-helix transcriptional regulator
MPPGPEPSQPDTTRAQVLSRLEDALRQALEAVPRDQVLRRLTAALQIEIDAGPGSRLHGRVRKVSVSMPEELADSVRARTGAGGFSGYVTDAVAERLRLELLDEVLAELEAEYGPVPEQMVEEAMREWPDYEE